MDISPHKRFVAGWIAVGAATLIASFWAFWGIVENFHEGWYSVSLWDNLTMMLVQYLGLMIIFMVLTAIAIRLPRLGGILYLAGGIWFCWFIYSSRPQLSLGVIFSWLPLTVPLLAIGFLFYIGRIKRRKLAYIIALGIPLFTLVCSGIGPAVRVMGRIDDGYYGARLVEGNDIALIWAPQGPGWPDRGVPYDSAVTLVRYLNDDGTALADTIVDIWRLPTVDEVVRSLTRRGDNCGGVWDAASARASYQRSPEKETPLWRPHSPIIYWWTAGVVNDNQVYRVVYDGNVWLTDRNWGADYLGFRAVREIPPDGHIPDWVKK